MNHHAKEAFPCPGFRVSEDTFLYPEPGMSLLDYAAVHLPELGDGLSQRWAESLNGTPHPLNTDEQAVMAWWAEAEARFRYLRAAAMLKARQAYFDLEAA